MSHLQNTRTWIAIASRGRSWSVQGIPAGTRRWVPANSLRDDCSSTPNLKFLGLVGPSNPDFVKVQPIAVGHDGECDTSPTFLMLRGESRISHSWNNSRMNPAASWTQWCPLSPHRAIASLCSRLPDRAALSRCEPGQSTLRGRG